MDVLKLKLKEFIINVQTVCGFIIVDIQRKPRTLKIGLFSIYIVIAFLVLLQSILLLTPTLFVNVAEKQNGIADLTLAPISAQNDTRLSDANTTIIGTLNLTDIQQQLEGLDSIANFYPRWTFPINASQVESEEVNYRAIGIILDSQKEREEGIGANLELPDLTETTCWVSETLASMMQLDDEIIFKVNLPSLFSQTENEGDSASNNSDIVHALTEQIISSFVGPEGLNLADTPLGEQLSRAGLNQDLVIPRSDLVDWMAPMMEETLNVTQTYQIAATVDDPEGKWASTYGNVVVIDSKYIAPMLTKRFIEVANTADQNDNSLMSQLLTQALRDPEIQSKIVNSSYGFDLNQFALQVNILLNDRIDIYESQSSMKENLIAESNEIYGRLGLDYPATASATLAPTLETFYLFQDFLNNVFTQAMFLLIILSILLIYSLMNSNVEDKNYEFGMLRVLGMRQRSLIILLSLQSMFFALPGLALGFIAAFAVNTVISFAVFDSTLLPTSYGLDSSAVGIGLGIGLAIPFISNILPTRKALSKTLRDFLNLYQRATSDVAIRMVKFNRIGVSLPVFCASVLLIVMGFLTFYLAPYAYAFSNMGLFFGIMNAVLMLMTLGLSFLAILLQGPIERFVLWVLTFAFWKNRPLRMIIKKNFDAHKTKNRKTSLMFILALAFLIFSGTGFKINSDMLIDQIKSTLGSDIVVKALPFETTFLNESDIRTQLNQFSTNYPSVIRDYAFVSQPFSLQKQVSSVDYSALTSTPELDADIVSVDESYLRSVYESLYVPDEYDPALTLSKVPDSNHLDGVEGLYKTEGLTPQAFDSNGILASQGFNESMLNQFIGLNEVRFIIPKALASMASTKVGSSSLIKIGSLRFRGRVRNIATKIPGFSFTGYKNPSATSTILTSHEDFRYIRDVVWELRSQAASQRAEIEDYNATIPENSSFGVPKLGLLVRLEKNVDKDTRQKLFNYVEVLVQGKFTITTNVAETLEILDGVLNYIQVFFILVSIIAIFLSFFFTVVAFTANVSENLWEFGVLRAVGLSKKQMCFVYIFEALSIVIAAGILGTAVGIIVSLLTSIQFNIYTELPFRFIFPTAVFCVAIGASLLTAIVGSKYAVDSVKHKQIATIIKALD